MCGIVGYIGKKEALPILIEGLRRESYRGYDSSGVVVFKGDKVFLVKEIGKLENLEKKLEGQKIEGKIGLGHIRWATHGGVTIENAHPHFDCKREIFLVHNGIIENYKELKEKLIKEGHKFTSETDTEVMCHLIEKYFNGNLEEAVRKMMKDIRGAYAIAVISKKDHQKIVAARMSSPLLLGINKG
jgi:glucosamine--fructose-6-phosphate aminotransferase (isomerizing)